MLGMMGGVGTKSEKNEPNLKVDISTMTKNITKHLRQCVATDVRNTKKQQL
jgi:hypothetical protein